MKKEPEQSDFFVQFQPFVPCYKHSDHLNIVSLPSTSVHYSATGTEAENCQLKITNVSHLDVEYCLTRRESLLLEEKHTSEAYFHFKPEKLKGSLVSSRPVY